MIDLIVFSVGSNRYALNIENTHRIIQATKLTDLPKASSLIDGILSYEGDVIKVLNFRKLIGLPSYDETLLEKFKMLEKAHYSWIDDLKNAVENGSAFTKTTDPHACELGKWLDHFTSYDVDVSLILKELMNNHKNLHVGAEEVLEMYKIDKSKALELLKSQIYNSFEKTISGMAKLMDRIESVSDSLQKFLIYENQGKVFGIKVDSIEDIAHIDASKIMSSDEEHINNFLELDGIIDLDGTLVNIIKKIDLPTNKE